MVCDESFSARSPTFSHLSTTLQGLPVIRAFKMEENFMSTFYKYQDKQTSAWNLFLSGYRWFGLRVDWLISLYLIGCIVAAFVTKSDGMSYMCRLVECFVPKIIGGIEKKMMHT